MRIRKAPLWAGLVAIGVSAVTLWVLHSERADFTDAASFDAVFGAAPERGQQRPGEGSLELGGLPPQRSLAGGRLD